MTAAGWNDSSWQNYLTIAFRVQAPETSNKPLVLDTPVPLFTGTKGVCFEERSIRVAAEDGSKMLVNMGNGDPNSFDMTVTADGIETTRQILWTDNLKEIQTDKLGDLVC